MTLSSLWHTVYPVLIAILFFELIILVHEGGHYFAARLMKIKVNEFSVGMGPKIIQRERNGTKFSLRWILFGGYCQMEGEGEDSEDPNAFNKKSVPARCADEFGAGLFVDRADCVRQQFDRYCPGGEV